MEQFSIILNIPRKESELTLTDWSLLRQTVRLVINYDPKDQSFRLN